jgi:hypothetical protein
MIVSKYGKSYDTADGTEQQFGPAARRGAGGVGESAPPRAAAVGAPLAASCQVTYTQKPAWSVLSLHDLNESIRRSNDPQDPARAQQESNRAAHARAQAAALGGAKAEAAAHAERNRHRNPWEHT